MICLHFTQASDTLNTATATVVVTVDDVNDVTPNFTESVYVASIAENVPPGSSVITVIANDDDAGESGVVVYTIVAGDITIFELDCEYSCSENLNAMYVIHKCCLAETL